jgi:hypothetical protein
MPKRTITSEEPIKKARKSLTKDTNNDGRITRSEGEECPVGDVNNDGRVTRSEARASKKAGFAVTYDSLK